MSPPLPVLDQGARRPSTSPSPSHTLQWGNFIQVSNHSMVYHCYADNALLFSFFFLLSSSETQIHPNISACLADLCNLVVHPPPEAQPGEDGTLFLSVFCSAVSSSHSAKNMA